MKKQLLLSPKKHGSPVHSKPSPAPAAAAGGGGGGGGSDNYSLPAATEVEGEVGDERLTPSSPRASYGEDDADDDTVSTNRTLGQSTPGDPSWMSCDPSQKSHDVLNDSIPSVQSASQRTLPPVPNRLVPSRSTERIMEMLNQHDMKKKEGGAGWMGDEHKQVPLSSTPACKSQERTRLSQVSQEEESNVTTPRSK